MNHTECSVLYLTSFREKFAYEIRPTLAFIWMKTHPRFPRTALRFFI